MKINKMPLIRSVLMSALYGPYLIGTSVVTLLLSVLFRNRTVDDWMVSAWGRGSCRMFGVRVHVEGLENLKKIHGAVLVFNHASFFDIFALAATIRGLRFGAKVELFKIPFFGAAMRQVGMLPIDRARRERVFRIYDEATARMHNGEKFALAPEGGRAGQSLAGAGAGAQVLAPFKSGPFVFAIQAKVPIVPVVIRGTSQVLPKGQLFPNWDRWSRNVEVRILAPLETQDYELKDRPELQEQVHLLMRSQLI